MDTEAEENPFASPAIVEVQEAPELASALIGVSPIDIRGICSVCERPASADYEQRYPFSRLVVRYSLCEQCHWRLKWQDRHSWVEKWMVYGLGVLLIWLPIISVIQLIKIYYPALWTLTRAEDRWLTTIPITHLASWLVVILVAIFLRVPSVFPRSPESLSQGKYRVHPRSPTFEQSLREHREEPA